MNVYLWIGSASIALVLVSVLASLRKYLAAVSLVGRSWIFYLPQAMVRKAWPHQKRRSIQITIDGDTLKIDNVTDEQQRKLLELWLSRHIETPEDGGVK
jgi:hypothetical protein